MNCSVESKDNKILVLFYHKIQCSVDKEEEVKGKNVTTYETLNIVETDIRK